MILVREVQLLAFFTDEEDDDDEGAGTDDFISDSVTSSFLPLIYQWVICSFGSSEEQIRRNNRGWNHSQN